MSINTHIKKWIDRADLVIDYYTLFIKAWIPFNAWYMYNYFDENNNLNSDRKIIDHIKQNPNSYRDKIKNLLTVKSEESNLFKDYLGKLHKELNNHPIPSFENKITFDNIVLGKNSKKINSFNKGAYSYKCEFKDQLPRTDKRFICEVLSKNTQQTKHRIELKNWNIRDLETNTDYLQITNESIKNNLKDCFQEINPNKPTSIIFDISQAKRNNLIKISDDLYFINDVDLVSSVIIHLIYELRCKLFHGEVEPKNANDKIYEYAYKIQRILIKELN